MGNGVYKPTSNCYIATYITINNYHKSHGSEVVLVFTPIIYAG